MFSLSIDTRNAAFDDGNKAQELARILRDSADRLEADRTERTEFILYDYNGNKVGTAELIR